RRRHTRLQGDWSSDVCSSDLPAEAVVDVLPRPDRSAERRQGVVELVVRTVVQEVRGDRRAEERREDQEDDRDPAADRDLVAAERSEERRVGKEWRARWGGEVE